MNSCAVGTINAVAEVLSLETSCVMSETDHTIISADLGSLRNMDKSCLYRIRLKKFVCWLKEFEVYIISRVDFLFDDQ